MTKACLVITKRAFLEVPYNFLDDFKMTEEERLALKGK